METNVERINKLVEHIGIVDNDVLTLGALSSYLTQRFGDEKILWRCTLGKKAAELCSNSQTRPQILLMDMSLSDADGVQICQEIRRTVDDSRFWRLLLFRCADMLLRWLRLECKALSRNEICALLPLLSSALYLDTFICRMS